MALDTRAVDIPIPTDNYSINTRSVAQSPSGNSLEDYVSSIESMLADRSYSVRVRSVSQSRVGIQFQLETHIGAKIPQAVVKHKEFSSKGFPDGKARIDIWSAYMQELEEACIFTNNKPDHIDFTTNTSSILHSTHTVSHSSALGQSLRRTLSSFEEISNKH